MKILEFIGVKLIIHKNGKIETLKSTNERINGRLDNRSGVVLKPYINKYGYEQITISNKDKRKTLLVHRLVALAFIKNKENKKTVNHIDGDKLNNNIENLEWLTNKEQTKHAIKLGMKSNSHLIKANNKRSIKVNFRGINFNSINEASRYFRVHNRVVKREGVII